MGKKLIDQLQDSYRKGYEKGHRDATVIIMQLCHMAFCVAMNKDLGIGAQRWERIRKTADTLLGVDVVEDVELTVERLNREYKKITGDNITDVIK